MLYFSPNSVHTVGVLAVTLGLDVWFNGKSHVYGGHFLCAGIADRACCLAPVQARRSLAPLSPEKHNGFSTIFLSAQKVVLVASGMPQMPSEGSCASLQSSLEVTPKLLLGSFFQDSSSRVPLRFLLKEACLRIPLAGFYPQDSTSGIPPSGFLLQDSSFRTPPPGFLL